MTALPEVPRYLVSRSAMFAWRENGMLTDQIGMVTYADHLTALRQQRDTALREALAAVEGVTVGGEHFWAVGYRDGNAGAAKAIQRLIDGPDMTPSDGGK